MNKCKLCGKNPIVERWSSGGLMYMIKCNNPDCPAPIDGYPKGRNLEEVMKEWNRINKDK